MASYGVVSFAVFVILLFSLFEEHDAKILVKPKSSDPPATVMLRKIQKLVELMDEKKGSGSIGLSLWDYRELVFNSPRNHTTFVLYYNDEDMCDSCGVILDAFDNIARSFALQYIKFDKKTSTWDIQVPAFFVKMKMSDGYRHMLVDVDPAKPSLYYFAPARSSKHNQFEQMDQEQFVPSLGEQFNSERMLGFIEHILEIRIPLKIEAASSNIFSTLMTAAMIGILVLFNIYHFGYWNYFKTSIQQGNHSYFITVIVIWLLSGQMFNYIRYTPMFGQHGFSLTSIIYPGSRSQYGSESIVVMLLYAMIMYAITSLVETRERQLSENLTMRDVQGSILGALSGFYFGFMGLQFISQIKTGRY